MQSITLNFVSLSALSAALGTLSKIEGLVDSGNSTAAPAPSARTAEAAPAAAPAEKANDSELTYEAVDNVLRAYSKKVDKDTFAKVMKQAGVSKVPELKEKPAIWAKLVAHCNKALNG